MQIKMQSLLVVAVGLFALPALAAAPVGTSTGHHLQQIKVSTNAVSINGGGSCGTVTTTVCEVWQDYSTYTDSKGVSTTTWFPPYERNCQTFETEDTVGCGDSGGGGDGDGPDDPPPPCPKSVNSKPGLLAADPECPKPPPPPKKGCAQCQREAGIAAQRAAEAYDACTNEIVIPAATMACMSGQRVTGVDKDPALINGRTCQAFEGNTPLGNFIITKTGSKWVCSQTPLFDECVRGWVNGNAGGSMVDPTSEGSNSGVKGQIPGLFEISSGNSVGGGTVTTQFPAAAGLASKVCGPGLEDALRVAAAKQAECINQAPDKVNGKCPLTP